MKGSLSVGCVCRHIARVSNPSHLNYLSNRFGPPRHTRLPLGSPLAYKAKESGLLYTPSKSAHPFPMWDCHFSLIFHFKIHILSLLHTHTHTNTLPTLRCLITLRDGKIQDKETIDNITYPHSKVCETKLLNSQFFGIEPTKA